MLLFMCPIRTFAYLLLGFGIGELKLQPLNFHLAVAQFVLQLVAVGLERFVFLADVAKLLSGGVEILPGILELLLKIPRCHKCASSVICLHSNAGFALLCRVLEAQQPPFSSEAVVFPPPSVDSLPLATVAAA